MQPQIKQHGSDLAGFNVGLVLGGIIGLCAGACGVAVVAKVDIGWYRQQAIERGFAEHDSKTGEWKWKEGNP